MAATGTYGFFPTTGELIVAAFRRIQIHRAELLTEHFTDAKTETNLMQVQWANLGPLVWTVDVQTITLAAGQSVYTIPPETVMLLDVYISTPNGDGTTSDRIITPLSRTEYASMPNKSGGGSPTSFWYDRTSAPTITLWPVPDGSETTLSYYRFSQIQDATTANASTPQVLYLCLDAYVAGLAHRMARLYKPELEGVREADAAKAVNLMFNQLVENVPLYIGVQSQNYWR